MNKKQISNIEMKDQTLAIRSWQIVSFDSASPPPPPTLISVGHLKWLGVNNGKLSLCL